MNIYILRHAESLSYSDNIDFESDPELSALGAKQAQLTAERLKELNIDTILTSTTQRAQNTAQIINNVLKKRVEFSDLIMEIKPPKIEIQDNRLQFLSFLNHVGEKETDPVGDDSRDESFEEIEARSLMFMKKLNEYHKDILIVTHSTFARILVLHMILGTFILPEQVKALHIDHGGLTTCQKVDNLWRLMTWNDTTHLGEYKSKNRF
jgi:broad specificity phosphatase PhoE